MIVMIFPVGTVGTRLALSHPMMHRSLLVAAALALVACGGQSSLQSGTDGAGSSSGGSGNAAGSSSTTAGQSSGGGGSGSSGSAGSDAGGASGGGGWGEACSGPPTTSDASCKGAFVYYTHDADRGLCRPFLYGGCGGTENLYPTLEACQAACSGGSPSSDVCDEPTDCVLAGAGCCGPCDTPSLAASDYIAYNHKFAAQVQLCGDIACGPCPEPEGESRYKYFAAGCVNHRCVVHDLRESAVTTCSRASDCKLRHGSNCCERCGNGADDALAVRADGSFEDLVCGADPPACPPCVPEPFEQQAVCDDGRCAVGAP